LVVAEPPLPLTLETREAILTSLLMAVCRPGQQVVAGLTSQEVLAELTPAAGQVGLNQEITTALEAAPVVTVAAADLRGVQLPRMGEDPTVRPEERALAEAGLAGI
jgi:hypothetical protein